ncbi:hypothetical protein AM501_28645 [Aneurinibacillus migulanus]|uniref:hypothetical protein n=1 Tax=Aneurinibacillus migulanus TaxID=47500 RepID=UPI0005B7D8C9|nr:hypothetical protein [Aneurinibacillus migulanus]KIV58387.1 hypothetical protein TS64_04855 [Aneurinibacillus migulanus]KPD05016.1 hypothetical protein AM501_28645 [Aneurinibacillus migulanus]
MGSSRTEFFIKDRYQRIEHGSFQIFYNWLKSLDEIRKHRISSRMLSITAETLVQRANLKKYPKHKIVHADLLLHYMAVLTAHRWPWFPRLYVYGDSAGKVDVLHRLKSRRHFQKAKALFGFTDENELKSMFETYKQPEGYRYDGSFESVPSLLAQINREEACSLP